MLPKSRRLNLKKDFKWVASGKRIDTKFLKIFYRYGENKTARVGIAVSSQTFKKAHERNRARRLVAEAFHNTYHLLPNTINIIALPKERVIEVKSNDVAKELEKILTDEKIIN